jgi:hypothetical protein
VFSNCATVSARKHKPGDAERRSRQPRLPASSTGRSNIGIRTSAVDRAFMTPGPPARVAAPGGSPRGSSRGVRTRRQRAPIRSRPSREALRRTSVRTRTAAAIARGGHRRPTCELERVRRQRRASILDVMRTHDPRRVGRVHRVQAADDGEVPYGGVLHPLNVGDVVDVSVPIDHVLRDRELGAVNRFLTRRHVFTVCAVDCRHEIPLMDRKAAGRFDQRLLD